MAVVNPRSARIVAERFSVRQSLGRSIAESCNPSILHAPIPDCKDERVKVPLLPPVFLMSRMRPIVIRFRRP